MLGIQLRFHATPDDHLTIFGWLSELSILVASYANDSDGRPVLKTRNISAVKEPAPERLCLLFEQYSREVRFWKVGDIWSIDDQNSLTIQYDCVFPDYENKYIGDSRLYAYKSYSLDSPMGGATKSAGFIREVQLLYRKLKRKLGKLENGNYAGKHALELIKGQHWTS